jgi:hypothetical protein
LTSKIKYINIVVIFIVTLVYILPSIVTTTVVLNDVIEQTTTESSFTDILEKDLNETEINSLSGCNLNLFLPQQVTLDYIIKHSPKEPVIQLSTPPPQG